MTRALILRAGTQEFTLDLKLQKAVAFSDGLRVYLEYEDVDVTVRHRAEWFRESDWIAQDLPEPEDFIGHLVPMPLTLDSLVAFWKKEVDRLQRPVLAVDFDGVIAKYDGWKGDKSFGDPIPGASECLKKIAESGVWICFTGDTKVSLVNGTEVPIKDLVGKDPFWVYSYDHETGKIVPGKATARKTRENAELVEVELDNGEKVRCTPDHPWMLRDGSYQTANKLKAGDGLMPLHRRYSVKFFLNYELFLQPGVNRWFYTHRLFAGPKPVCLLGERKCVVHHKNFNRRDNCPENLVWMSFTDHRLLHNLSKEIREKISVANTGRKRSAEFRARVSAKLSEIWKDPVRRERQSVRVKELRQNPALEEVRLVALRASGWKISCALSGRSRSVEARLKTSRTLLETLERTRPIRRVYTIRFGLNHKVVSVRALEEREDVYDLTVEKYHNFALTAGVFVHNCLWTTRAPVSVLHYCQAHDIPVDSVNSIFFRPWAKKKVCADVYLDDRGLRFMGVWDEALVEQILNFRPYWESANKPESFEPMTTVGMVRSVEEELRQREER
jgi:hypothetical protein